MNHLDVQIIGVFDPDGKDEAFCYTVDAPINLWVSALVDDGSRMGSHFMAFILNELIEADCFGEGDAVLVSNQDGAVLTATVGRMVPAVTVQANVLTALHGRLSTIRVVTVAVTP